MDDLNRTAAGVAEPAWADVRSPGSSHQSPSAGLKQPGKNICVVDLNLGWHDRVGLPLPRKSPDGGSSAHKHLFGRHSRGPGAPPESEQHGGHAPEPYEFNCLRRGPHCRHGT
jgi:hypothetical protein